MEGLAELVIDISVVFSDHRDLPTLLPPLVAALAGPLPLVEGQVIALDEAGESADIVACAPKRSRIWTGQRSARFFARCVVDGPRWATELEPARVAFDELRSRLDVPVGPAGMLSLGFSVDMQREHEITDILVKVLEGQCRRLGELDQAGRELRAAQRNIVEKSEAGARETAEPADPDTDMKMELLSSDATDISVVSFDAAVTRCIATALSHTHGRIYGEGGAAQLLGLKPSTLQSKMRKLGIERAHFTE